jgi:hypothetical protein
MSDLNDAEESFGDLCPSETDKEAFLRICTNSWNSSNSLHPRTIEVARETQSVGTTQLNGMVFCTPEEAFGNSLNWEKNLEECHNSFKKEFDLTVKSLQDTSFGADIIKHFGDLKRRKGAEQRYIVIGEDLTKPHQILDLCGVLLFYDIDSKVYETAI